MAKPRATHALLIVAASLLLVGDVLQLTAEGIAWTVVLALSFTAFAAGLLLLPGTLGGPANRLAQLGSALAFLGAVAGVGMQAMFRAFEVLEAASEQHALEILQGYRGIALTTLAPGIFFPLGLLVLSAVLFYRRRPATALTMAAGSVLFPVGHAVGFAWALVAGDVVLVAAFATLAFGTDTSRLIPS